MSERPDPDLESLIAEQRRYGARRAWRFCAAGFGVALVSGLVAIAGMLVDAWQSPSPIQLLLPKVMVWGGFGGVAGGTLMGALCALIAVRLRLRRGL